MSAKNWFYRRLRIMMKMHGLGDGAYFSVQYLWFLALYCAYMVVLIVIASAVNIGFFRRNSYGLQIVHIPSLCCTHSYDGVSDGRSLMLSACSGCVAESAASLWAIVRDEPAAPCADGDPSQVYSRFVMPPLRL